MTEYTGFNDHSGNKIWSDSKIEYCDTAPAVSITTEHLIVKQNEVYGVEFHGYFNPLKSLAKVWDYSSGEEKIIIYKNIPYVSLVEKHVK